MEKLEKQAKLSQNSSIPIFLHKNRKPKERKKIGWLDFWMAEPCVSSSVCVAKILELHLEGRPIVWGQEKGRKILDPNPSQFLVLIKVKPLKP